MNSATLATAFESGASLGTTEQAVALIMLSLAVLWGVRKLIKTVNRS